MKLTPLPLSGAYLIEIDRHWDDRGYFARTFCCEEFESYGLITTFSQMSTSFNHRAGQIRGMHYQEAPYEETKIVRCTRGALYDLMIDLRPDSGTYQHSYGTELSAENGKMFYIPKGFAHGYKTLQDNTEVFYMMDTPFHPTAAREIPWPL